MPPPRSIPCEFRKWTLCNETFDPQDVGIYIDHVGRFHLNQLFPAVCVCWFCDDARFECGPGRDPFACYSARMEHIAGHYRSDAVLGRPRADFAFLKHLRSRGLISEAAYKASGAESELPPLGITINSNPRPTREPGYVCVEPSRSQRRRQESRPAASYY